MTPNDIVIVGAGGHSRVVVSILRQTDEWSISGIIDTDYKGQVESIMGVEVIGGENKLAELEPSSCSVFVAIGDNLQRSKWYRKLERVGFNIPTLISKFAYVDPSASLGKGNLIGAFSYVGPGCIIGDNNILNTRSNLEHESSMGDHNHLAPSATTGGRCRIDDQTFIGAGSVLLPSVEITNKVIVGANSLVAESLDSSGTYVGSPVRKIK